MQSKEARFLSSIDCRLPYGDEKGVVSLINAAMEISDNAAFGVLEEIARVPAGTTVSLEFQEQMIAVWKDRVSHPLAEEAAEAALCLCRNQDRPLESTLESMDATKSYPGLYGALNIFYFAASDDTGVLDQEYAEVEVAWIDMER